MASTRPVVAAVDGSQHSLEAAQWAATEAGCRHALLHLLAVNDDPARTEYADNAVRSAQQRCREHRPGVDITTEVATGHAIDELIRRSKHAQLIVLGAHGHDDFPDALLGSVSDAVATHTECPVVVVRGSPPTTAPIVVGVDESPGSHTALRFAFEAAAQRGAELIAIQAWHEEEPLTPQLPAGAREPVQRHIERRLARHIAECSAHYPGVRKRTVAAQPGHPVAALTAAAQDAQLLVVGHRGHGGFRSVLLGSVASGVLHYAHCPVAVVPIGTKTQL